MKDNWIVICGIVVGLSYLTPSNEDKLKTEIKDRHEGYKNQSSGPLFNNSQTPIAIPSEFEDFISNVW